MRDREATGNVTLTVPPEEAAIRVALMNPSHGMFADDDLRKPRNAPYDDFRLSDKGGYVKGVVDLFGGLHAASSFFGNSFWRGVVEHVCDRSPLNDEDALRPIANKLHKVQDRLLRDLEQKRLDSLSRYVLELARAQPTRSVDLTWDSLERRFTAQRAKYLELHPEYFEGSTPEERTRDDERALRDLRRALQEYVEAGVFFQGVRYRCSACGFPFWRSISEARQVVDCDGCRAEVAMQVEEGWTYRLNSLVKNAVAHYGTIPVIWTVTSLRWRSRTMFVYSPGVELFRSYDDVHPVSDLDVVCIQDGALVVGEVKTSPSEFNDERLKKLGDVATHLAVDGVVLAAFRSDEQQIRRVAERLESQFPNRAFSVIRLAPNSEVNDPVPGALASKRWRL
jgi:DNA-directed RNA polymerase subunit RPC12/RpoP